MLSNHMLILQPVICYMVFLARLSWGEGRSLYLYIAIHQAPHRSNCALAVSHEYIINVHPVNSQPRTRTSKGIIAQSPMINIYCYTYAVLTCVLIVRSLLLGLANLKAVFLTDHSARAVHAAVSADRFSGARLGVGLKTEF